LCLLSALLLLDLPGLPLEDLRVGEVAPLDLRAPTAFEFEDGLTTDARRDQAAEGEPPVYAFDPLVAAEISRRLRGAFEDARSQYGAALMKARSRGLREVDEGVLDTVSGEFLSSTGFELSPEAMDALATVGFAKDVEDTAVRLLKPVMKHYIIADRALLPPVLRPIAVVQFGGDNQQEVRLETYEHIWTLERARQQIRDDSDELAALAEEDKLIRVGAAVARSAVRLNFSNDLNLTSFRRQEARRQVSPAIQSVDRGTSLVRGGDVITAQQGRMLNALRHIQQDQDRSSVFGGLFLLCMLFFGALGRFASTFVSKFSGQNRDLAALAGLMVLTLGLARFTVEVSAGVTSRGNLNLAPELVWYLVPVGGVALRVRMLMNSETALVFSVAAGTLCGVLMDQQALYAAYFVLSSVTAAGAIGMDRDRKALLRAGVLTGVVNAIFVLLVGLAQTQLLDDSGAAIALARPFWSALFALASGFLSAFLVLALLPLFELAGFVTNLQLMELANLNHPLMRNLLLRAPGSYHHSVMVGSLSEAAAEAIGCNALLARVASYFHDIGKAVTPQYFVENYRGAGNPHDRLNPQQSARIIIDHVRNGGAIAKRYNLPAPIVDNIYMHHGTGLLYYFYRKAQETDPDVSEADFRYPGPRPNTREAGIIHLADKVEAACRSVREPTPDRIAAMIQKILNSTLADGQLEECPLTLKDLYTIAGVFQESILAIHHQRIEYPDTQDLSRAPVPVVTGPAPAAHPPAAAQVPVAASQEAGEENSGRERVITLDLPPREGEEIRRAAIAASASQAGPVDYESVDQLPGSLGPRGNKNRGQGGK
jgi:putative nucleotidyltransferase with HDIG domain